jgi:hypothetical protein
LRSRKQGRTCSLTERTNSCSRRICMYDGDRLRTFPPPWMYHRTSFLFFIRGWVGHLLLPHIPQLVSLLVSKCCCNIHLNWAFEVGHFHYQPSSGLGHHLEDGLAIAASHSMVLLQTKIRGCHCINVM